jgi:hypothetical protein
MTVYPPELGPGHLMCEGAAMTTSLAYTYAVGLDGQAFVVLSCEGDLHVSLKSRHYSPAFCPGLLPLPPGLLPPAPPSAATRAPSPEASVDSGNNAVGSEPEPAPAAAARARQASTELARSNKRQGAGEGEGPSSKRQVRPVSSRHNSRWQIACSC